MAASVLDDILLQLGSIDAKDVLALRAIHERVSALAEQANAVQKRMFSEAANSLSALITGSAADPTATLGAVQRFLQAGAAVGATRALAKPADGPKPADEPKAEAPVEVPAGPVFVFDEADRELVAEFVTEALDYVTQAEGAMLLLESNPSDMPAVDTVFRAFHTVKGVSAMLGLEAISTLAHKAESLLSKVRSKDLVFSGAVANLALASVDAIKALVEGVNATLSGEPWSAPHNLGDLAATLAQATEGRLPPIDAVAAPAPVATPQVQSEVATSPEPAPPSPSQQAPTAEPTPPSPAALQMQTAPAAAPAALNAVATVAAPTPAVQVPAAPAQTPAAQPQAPATQPQAPAQAQAPARADNESTSVRIRTERLDRLVDMVGELVIAHSMVRQDPTLARSDHMDLTRKVAHAGKIVRELQELAMSLRMVPLKPTFQKLARVVRDTAQKSGKAVELIVAGEETEIDRNMVDIIADPLVHMLRNGVDHGIESPNDRIARGKPRAGTIRLTALHSGGNVVVELCDDGAGLDRQRIVKKAIERGLIESDAQMTDSDVYNLIFEPGFSTRDQVNDLSGRGVGMDVVRRNVQALNGRVDIASTLGSGTTFTLRLPLTLAVTDGMLVRVGDERFIVPTVNIQTSLRPLPEHLSTVSTKGELLFIRGELIPMFRLHRLFDLNGATEDPTKALAVVVNGVEGRCALLVDELLGQQQVVAKSLGEGIGNVRGIAGGAILGDGRVGLILDTPEIIALARETASHQFVLN
jgi:two-component system chemotaxis sensor kinase CheA